MDKRIDAIIFDLKESLDDLGNEIKIIQQNQKKLNKKIKEIDIKYSNEQ